MPSSRFQYLQAGIRYVGPDGTFAQNFRVYWQQFIDALDTALDNIIAAQADIIETQQDILDMLVRLGLVEVLADGTFDIVDQGLNPDGTVKPNKVLTESAVAEAWSAPDLDVGTDTTIPSGGTETTIYTSGVKTVGDATYGSCTIVVQFTWDNSTDSDAGAEFYIETKTNGGSWVRQTDATFRVGTRTDGGDTYSYTPVNQMYPMSAAGMETMQAQLIGKSIAMTGSAGTFDSTALKPRIMIVPGKR